MMAQDAEIDPVAWAGALSLSLHTYQDIEALRREFQAHFGLLRHRSPRLAHALNLAVVARAEEIKRS